MGGRTLVRGTAAVGGAVWSKNNVTHELRPRKAVRVWQVCTAALHGLQMKVNIIFILRSYGGT